MGATDKMINIGVDSCPAGWLAIYYNPYIKYFKVAKTFLELFDECWFKDCFDDNIFCLVDIPIGLCNEARRCDQIARSILGKRSSSVFSTPVHDAVYANTYEEAKAINFKLTGKYISKQAWNICPKIRDVNDCYHKFPLRIIVKEMHPEVCFWALNEKKPCEFYKKTPEGKEERLNILSNYCKDSQKMFEIVRNETNKKDVADDDIIDALVGAITGNTNRLISFPYPLLQRGKNGYISEMVFHNGDLIC